MKAEQTIQMKSVIFIYSEIEILLDGLAGLNKPLEDIVAIQTG